MIGESTEESWQAISPVSDGLDTLSTLSEFDGGESEPGSEDGLSGGGSTRHPSPIRRSNGCRSPLVASSHMRHSSQGPTEISLDGFNFPRMDMSGSLSLQPALRNYPFLDFEAYRGSWCHIPPHVSSATPIKDKTLPQVEFRLYGGNDYVAQRIYDALLDKVSPASRENTPAPFTVLWIRQRQPSASSIAAGKAWDIFEYIGEQGSVPVDLGRLHSPTARVVNLYYYSAVVNPPHEQFRALCGGAGSDWESVPSIALAPAYLDVDSITCRNIRTSPDAPLARIKLARTDYSDTIDDEGADDSEIVVVEERRILPLPLDRLDRFSYAEFAEVEEPTVPLRSLNDAILPPRKTREVAGSVLIGLLLAIVLLGWNWSLVARLLSVALPDHSSPVSVPTMPEFNGANIFCDPMHKEPCKFQRMNLNLNSHGYSFESTKSNGRPWNFQNRRHGDCSMRDANKRHVASPGIIARILGDETVSAIYRVSNNIVDTAVAIYHTSAQWTLWLWNQKAELLAQARQRVADTVRYNAQRVNAKYQEVRGQLPKAPAVLHDQYDAAKMAAWNLAHTYQLRMRNWVMQ